MKFARANCAGSIVDRQLGKDRHEKTECLWEKLTVLRA